jgi:hypothetical protein
MTEKQKLEIRGELFALCSAGVDASLKRAAGIICKLSAEERLNVRAGIERLSYLMDDVFLDECRQKRIEARKQ